MISNSEKALNKMITMCVAKNFNPKEVTLEKCVETIRNDLDRLEKLEKVVDIIKLLYISTYEEKENDKSIYELYCVGKGVYITKEEYELLREVLEDVKD